MASRWPADGTIFATGPGGVLVLSKDGKRLGRINDGKATANCKFGDDGKTLYLTSHDMLARIRLNVTGRRILRTRIAPVDRGGQKRTVEIAYVLASIVLLVLLISWGKVQPFLAFLVASSVAAILLGLPMDKVPGVLEKGIGNILGGLHRASSASARCSASSSRTAARRRRSPWCSCACSARNTSPGH